MNETTEEEPKDMVKIGKVTHYFTKIGVAVLELSDTVAVGDEITIRGQTTNFTQTIDSMEIDKVKVETAGKGQSIGLKVRERVRQNDDVYKVAK